MFSTATARFYLYMHHSLNIVAIFLLVMRAVYAMISWCITDGSVQCRSGSVSPIQPSSRAGGGETDEQIRLRLKRKLQRNRTSFSTQQIEDLEKGLILTNESLCACVHMCLVVWLFNISRNAIIESDSKLHELKINARQSFDKNEAFGYYHPQLFVGLFTWGIRKRNRRLLGTCIAQGT